MKTLKRESRPACSSSSKVKRFPMARLARSAKARRRQRKEKQQSKADSSVAFLAFTRRLRLQVRMMGFGFRVLRLFWQPALKGLALWFEVDMKVLGVTAHSECFTGSCQTKLEANFLHLSVQVVCLPDRLKRPP